MKKYITILIALLFTINAFSQDNARVKVGQNVPEFTVNMVDGTSINISELKGKVVLINFWATWCPPCKAELKRVQKEIVDRFDGNDFQFIAISRGEAKETVMKFRHLNGYKFPMGLDPDASIFNLFAESSIPRNFIIDREGKIAAIEIGYSEELFKRLVSKIDKTLKQKK